MPAIAKGRSKGKVEEKLLLKQFGLGNRAEGKVHSHLSKRALNLVGGHGLAVEDKFPGSAYRFIEKIKNKVRMLSSKLKKE